MPCLVCHLLLLFLFSATTIGFAETQIVDHAISIDTQTLHINVHYPQVHQDRIDSDIKGWAQQLVENFTSSHSESSTVQVPYELRTEYSITRPSNRYISIIVNISNYTGGAHGNLDITVFNYNTITGTAIDLIDVFEDLDIALQLMSQYSYAYLSEKLGDMLDKTLLYNGTAPEIDNYSAVALTPKGIRIFFQPYQVAPWAAGPQYVDMNLEELHTAKPDITFWKKS